MRFRRASTFAGDAGVVSKARSSISGLGSAHRRHGCAVNGAFSSGVAGLDTVDVRRASTFAGDAGVVSKARSSISGLGSAHRRHGCAVKGAFSSGVAGLDTVDVFG